jgi:hypothetical protein
VAALLKRIWSIKADLDLDAYERAVAEKVRAIDEFDRKAVEDALAMLDRLRVEVIGNIAQGGLSDYTLARMQATQASIDARISEFKDRLTAQLQSDLQTGFQLGVDLVDTPLAQAGLRASLTGISREVILVASQFSADLIQNLTNDIRADINEILRRAVTGVITTQEAIAEVGASLEDEGAFKSIAARSEAIVRTETLRIQAQASQARMQVSAANMPEGYVLRKRWLTANDDRVRDTHDEAEGQERDVDEPFEVGGEECMYPRDASLSAAESVNCRCVSISVISKPGEQAES